MKKLGPLRENLIEQKIGPSSLRSWSKVDSTETPELDPEAFDLPWSELLYAVIPGVVHVVMDG